VDTDVTDCVKVTGFAVWVAWR